MAKARSLVFIIGIPTTSAATSMSRTAIQARPMELRTMFLAASAITLTIARDRKSTRLNSSHDQISYAVFCLKKKTMNSGIAKHIKHIHCALRNTALISSVECASKPLTVWLGLLYHSKVVWVYQPQIELGVGW